MNRRNPWQSYQRVAAETASPGHLVLMLYEGAIRFLESALRGFDLEDPAEHHQTICNGILRTQAILDELNGALNMEDGGDFARNMRGLYNYLDRRLQESNFKKDAEGIREVSDRIAELRDAWSEMLQNGSSPRAEAITQPVPATPAFIEAAVA